MYRVFLIIVIIYSVFIFESLAGGIRGHVRNSADEPIPFAAIYVAALHHGTTANEEGAFQLALPEGTHEVRFQYLGYQTRILELEIAADVVKLDVILDAQQYRLPEVIVTASGEDPAYYIMRRTIGLSQYYLNQVSSYTCLVYLKGSGVVNSMPAIIRRQMEREGVAEGRYFVTENISRIRFDLPDQVQTEVISIRSSGDDNQSSPMAFITISLYRDINGVISPLSRNAFQVYRFVLEGSFTENGHQIHKIRVIPRRPGSDLYSGTIFIREGSWNLHSVDLQMSQNMFRINFRQVYNPVAENVWMPVSHNYEMNLSLLGIDIDFTYLASVSEYVVGMNEALDHDFYLSTAAFLSDPSMLRSLEGSLPVRERAAIPLEERSPGVIQSSRQEAIQSIMSKENLSNLEMRRLNRLIRQEARAGRQRGSLEVKPLNTEIAESARQRSMAYWDVNRPVPLTSEEMESFEESPTDSITDSDATKKRVRQFGKILMGGSYRLTNGWSIHHGGLYGLSGLEFNTVDGFTYSQSLRLSHSAADGNRFQVSNRTSWAFARRRMLSISDMEYIYDPFRRASLKISGGRVSSDFHAEQGIPPMFNTITSLYFKQNFMKLHERSFLRMDHRIDIVNGLIFRTGAEYAQRIRLYNNTGYSITNPYGRIYTLNMPPVNRLPEGSLDDHHAAIIDLSLSYTPRYYYRLADKRKIMLYSSYPTFSIALKQGVAELWKSEVRFSHLETSVKQSFTLQMIGQFHYHLTGGTFFNNEGMYFADYKHFFTNPLFVIPGTDINMFRSMPYYTYSTNETYALAHMQYDHSRILLKRLPFLADKLMREKIFVNSLFLAGHKPYVEIGYGLDQLFLVLSLEFVSAFSGGRNHYNGIRIGIPLNEATIRL